MATKKKMNKKKKTAKKQTAKKTAKKKTAKTKLPAWKKPLSPETTTALQKALSALVLAAHPRARVDTLGSTTWYRTGNHVHCRVIALPTALVLMLPHQDYDDPDKLLRAERGRGRPDKMLYLSDVADVPTERIDAWLRAVRWAEALKPEAPAPRPSRSRKEEVWDAWERCICGGRRRALTMVESQTTVIDVDKVGKKTTVDRKTLGKRRVAAAEKIIAAGATPVHCGSCGRIGSRA